MAGSHRRYTCIFFGNWWTFPKKPHHITFPPGANESAHSPCLSMLGMVSLFNFSPLNKYLIIVLISFSDLFYLFLTLCVCIWILELNCQSLWNSILEFWLGYLESIDQLWENKHVNNIESSKTWTRYISTFT